MITIGIPTVNGPDRLLRCLQSIWNSTDFTKLEFRVLVIDDGSEEWALEQNKEVCARYGINLIMNNERLGVAKSWNKLVLHYNDAEYIVLLNDDIEVVRDWLEVLVWSMEQNPELGPIGLNAYEGDKPEQVFHPTYSEAKLMFGGPTTPILSCRGYAFGFRREHFNLVNGFDGAYFCFFEEVDFCLSLLVAGKRSSILSYPIVYHGHGLTTKSVLDDPQAVFNTSKETFESKWKCKWESLRTLFPHYVVPDVPDIINEWNGNIKIWQ